MRPLSIAEEAEMAALAATAETAPDMERTRQIAIRLVEWAVCDEGGRPIFGEEDLERLRDMQGSALRRLADAILHHSGLTESARRELEKNSPGAPSGA